jgi:hypothetical protein
MHITPDFICVIIVYILAVGYFVFTASNKTENEKIFMVFLLIAIAVAIGGSAYVNQKFSDPEKDPKLWQADEDNIIQCGPKHWC